MLTTYTIPELADEEKPLVEISLMFSSNSDNTVTEALLGCAVRTLDTPRKASPGVAPAPRLGHHGPAGPEIARPTSTIGAFGRQLPGHGSRWAGLSGSTALPGSAVEGPQTLAPTLGRVLRVGHTPLECRLWAVDHWLGRSISAVLPLAAA